MKKTIIGAAIAIALAVSGAHAQSISPDELNSRSIQRRAIEAVIWGMPVVNYDLMLQEMFAKTEGKVGQAIYWGRPLDWHNQTLTPNPDALYFMVFFNTKDGPVVLDLPPGDNDGSFNGNIVTVWQMPLEDAGLLGADKGSGGKISGSAAGVFRQTAGRDTSHCNPIRSADTCCSDQISGATAPPTSRRPSPTASGSRCIRWRKPKILLRPFSPTSRTSTTIRPSAMTRASSSILIAWCRASHGCSAIGR